MVGLNAEEDFPDSFTLVDERENNPPKIWKIRGIEEGDRCVMFYLEGGYRLQLNFKKVKL